MAVHVAILLPRYIRMLLDGVKTVESRLTIQDRAPYKRVTPGDRIYFKASGGAYQATAIAAKVEYHDSLTPAKVDALKRKHNAAVCGDDQYWSWKRNSRFATFIKLRDVEATERGPALQPSQGIAWFTLADDDARLERLDARPYRVVTMKTNTASATGNGDTQRRPGRRSRTAAVPASHAGPAPPDLRAFISPRELATIVRVARREDLGPKHRDVTSELLIPRERATSAVFVARAPGVLAGVALLPAVVKEYDASVKLETFLADGSPLKKSDRIAELRGSLRSVLAIERVALNFLTHLSGIASLARRYADAVAGTKAGVYDTRKTHAGLRTLEKYAVVCGGGRSHRMGLYDAVLVKDNHIAHIPLESLPAELGVMIAKAREVRPRLKFVQIEVDRLEQLERVLPLRPDIVLLDNMPPEVLSKAVAMRDRVAPGVELEASGGVNLDTVGAIARTGVDRISARALTHSAIALDIALDIAG